ncbi:a641e0ef-6667-49e0-85f3-6d6de953918b [Sclerotinia trifoliorum]|uniref:A641e0ef-6667-49e0-85f3-6d6de953918b n=1 Tax=Sclerotinia trifoliorum TaxID=28548 RepID=A0A8H2ZPN4_9HELO|nr:a641e0ef-6667-49e0-85f3-6d6de953918b [Sclerotinia trifoliorum]
MPRIRPHTSKTSSKSQKIPHPTPSISKRTKNSYSNGAMKPIFSGCKMSLAGDFIAEHPGPNAEQQWNYEKISKWIRVHGGEYATEVDGYTTHLIVTIKEYKKKSVQVCKAMSMGKRCHIIVIDWLVDCLTSKLNKKKKLAVTGYTLGRVIRRLHHTEDQKIKYRQRFEEGVKACEELCDNRLHHVYTDQTDFEYKVVLTRVLVHGKNKNQKYTVYLFASNAQPSTYMAGAKLTTAYQSPCYLRDECRPKVFSEAFSDFKAIFKCKTGIEWDDRYEPLPKNHSETLFRYQRPTLGRPMGMLPSWRKAPSWKDEDLKFNVRALDPCGEEINENDEDDDEVAEKERANERRNEKMAVQRRLAERRMMESSQHEYDSDSEVDDDETFDELMRDQLPSPPSSPRKHQNQSQPQAQAATGMEKEEIIVISDSETDTGDSGDGYDEIAGLTATSSTSSNISSTHVSQPLSSFSASGNSISDSIIL